MAIFRNVSTDTVLSYSVERARNGWQRAVGFLLRPSVPAERGLWLERCNAIHTLGMRTTLDVIFLDRDERVIAVEAAVQPHRPVVSRRGTCAIVECGPGFLAAREVTPGDRLELV